MTVRAATLVLTLALVTAACDAPAETPVAAGQAPAATPTPNPDRAALVALYHATDGPNWKRNSNWLSEAPLGLWNLVHTDPSGRVTSLWLQDNQLRGEIPAELGSLSSLVLLLLNGNELRGGIPPELGSLAKLDTLMLSENQLSGEIPPELGRLTNLRNLRLDNNQLRGEIPPELGSIPYLELLKLGGSNRFTGCIPQELHESAFGHVLLTDLDELGLPFCGAADSASTDGAARRPRASS